MTTSPEAPKGNQKAPVKTPELTVADYDEKIQRAQEAQDEAVRTSDFERLTMLRQAEAMLQMQRAETARREIAQSLLAAEPLAKKQLRAALKADQIRAQFNARAEMRQNQPAAPNTQTVSFDKYRKDTRNEVTLAAVAAHAKEVAEALRAKGITPDSTNSRSRKHAYRFVRQEPTVFHPNEKPWFEKPKGLNGVRDSKWQDEGYKAPNPLQRALRVVAKKTNFPYEPKQPNLQRDWIWAAEVKSAFDANSSNPEAQNFTVKRGWGMDADGNLSVINWDRIRPLSPAITLSSDLRGGSIDTEEPLDMLRRYSAPLDAPGDDEFGTGHLRLYDHFVGQLDDMYESLTGEKFAGATDSSARADTLPLTQAPDSLPPAITTQL